MGGTLGEMEGAPLGRIDGGTEGLRVTVGPELGLALGALVSVGAPLGVAVGKLVLGREEGTSLGPSVGGTVGPDVRVGEFDGRRVVVGRCVVVGPSVGIDDGIPLGAPDGGTLPLGIALGARVSVGGSDPVGLGDGAALGVDDGVAVGAALGAPVGPVGSDDGASVRVGDPLGFTLAVGETLGRTVAVGASVVVGPELGVRLELGADDGRSDGARVGSALAVGTALGISLDVGRDEIEGAKVGPDGSVDGSSDGTIDGTREGPGDRDGAEVKYSGSSSSRNAAIRPGPTSAIEAATASIAAGTTFHVRPWTADGRKCNVAIIIDGAKRSDDGTDAEPRLRRWRLLLRCGTRDVVMVVNSASLATTNSVCPETVF